RPDRPGGTIHTGWPGVAGSAHRAGHRRTREPGQALLATLTLRTRGTGGSHLAGRATGSGLASVALRAALTTVTLRAGHGLDPIPRGRGLRGDPLVGELGPQRLHVCRQ